jgi:tyrosine-protein phosphatase YwqE
MMELLLARMDDNQKTMKTNQDVLLKTVKEKIQATMRKMEAGIHSIRSELENRKQRTQNHPKQLTETIKKTHVELQRV